MNESASWKPGCDCAQRGIIGGTHHFLCPNAKLADVHSEERRLIDKIEWQKEQIEHLSHVVVLAEDYIEGNHDYHLHADFETVRVPIARQKREALRISIVELRELYGGGNG